MNELYLEEVIHRNCKKCKEIYSPHTQSYKFEKLSEVLCFNLKRDVNILIDGESIFTIIGTGVFEKR